MQHQTENESTVSSPHLKGETQRGDSYTNGNLPLNPRIVIIGAGISGLSAAYHLHLKGFTNILLIEASSQIGGRICTIQHDNGILELGGQWIQGQQDNPVWNFAVEHGIVDEKNPVITGEGLGIYLTPDGTAIPQNLVGEVDQVIKVADEDCAQLMEMTVPSDYSNPPTVEDYFYKHFKNYMDQNDDSPRIKDLKLGLYSWNLTFHCLDNACHSLKDLSAIVWGEYINLEGSRWVTLPSGYREILNKMASDLPRNTIITNKSVVNIEWGRASSRTGHAVNIADIDYCRAHRTSGQTENQHQNSHAKSDIKPYDTSNNDEISRYYQARVMCSDETSFGADHVIVTVSLGVLKRDQETLFKPLLPHKKMKTISTMGFGTLNKIFLIFETPFWDSDTRGFQLVWTPSDHDAFKDPNCDYGWYKDITGFDVLPTHANILLCWIGKRGGEIMESLSDAHVIDTCVRLLSQFTGKRISKITKIIRSNWHSNPFTKGSYSHRTIDMDKNKCHTNDLASPIFYKNSEYPLLQFAGEATEINYFSTVHGAFISGKREADLLIKLYSS